MKTLYAVTAALLVLAPAVASAQGPAPAASSGPVRPGWYVAPMALYLESDPNRCNTDSNYGAVAAVGHRGDIAALEIWAQYLKLPFGGCTYTVPDSGNPPANPDGDADDDPDSVSQPSGDVGMNAVGFALITGPFFEDELLARFFGVIGFGIVQRKDAPHHPNEGDTTIFGDVGFGYLHPLSLFGRDAAVRIELRYRYDAEQPPHAEGHDPAPPHGYNDLVLQAGLQFALSPAAQAPATEPVSVVPVADSDGDGVTDDKDTCPGTSTSTTVDATGCEPTPVAPSALPAEPTLETAKAGDTIVLHGVNFETAKATLTTNAQALLDGVAQQLNHRPELNIEIGGHTDNRGAESYNQSLSQQRADAALNYLAAHGVDASRLSAVGYGEAQPVETNETDEGRERNRRVELKVLEPAQPEQPVHPSTGEGS